MIFEHIGVPEDLGIKESLFALGNGYIGVRSSPSEGRDGLRGSQRGSYINGIYERIPMHHAEMAYGFPTMIDKQPRICDTQSIEIILDGVALSESSLLLHYKEELDLEKGLYRRSFFWEHPSGKLASLGFMRLASFRRKELFVYHVDIDYPGEIELRSYIDTKVKNYIDQEDPRIGKVDELLRTTQLEEDTETTDLLSLQKTLISQQQIACRVMHLANTEGNLIREEGRLGYSFSSRDSFQLEKRALFSDSRREEEPKKHLERLASSLRKISLEEIKKEQEDYLGDFWKEAKIEIEGDPESELLINWQIFHLLQSTGRDHLSNISAKGLSGEGYEGHYFWDTEVYMLPLWQLLSPSHARSLLDFRIATLPLAKDHAKIMGHDGGAYYPWRTISGIESSGYYPAGSAQVHLSGDIAFSMLQEYLLTEDQDFLFSGALEVILETARTWLELGNMDDEGFHLHNVTGPDEYSAVVSDNYYTNRLAQVHLRSLVELFHELRDDPRLEVFRRDHGVIDEELKRMKEASENMVLPYDEKLGIHKQDSLFLEKPQWPEEKKKRPLLLHYHPLYIYRHQILKQADTILSYLLREEEDSYSVMERSYAYYEPRTTHDSSLSACIYGMMAARLGKEEDAWEYFKQSLLMDHHNLQGNTHHGLHMANMAGTVLFILKGFAGIRLSPLTLRPILPTSWKSYTFHFHYKGRLIRVRVGERITLNLIKGEPLELKVYDQSYHLVEEVEVDYAGNHL